MEVVVGGGGDGGDGGRGEELSISLLRFESHSL